MKNSTDVVTADLNYICEGLQEEFPSLSGKRLLIAGGAGFLGYYLVQAVLHWNRLNADKAPVSVLVYDNFMRGVPDWLDSLKDDANLSVEKYDVIDPLPADMGDVHYIIHAATIASDRNHGCQCLRAQTFS